MPCFHLRQVPFFIRDDGKKKLRFDLAAIYAELFAKGIEFDKSNVQTLCCGMCVGCRLECSRQWGIRCMHEAMMHVENCFVTFTFRDEDLPKNRSLDKTVMPAFMKKLRSRLSYGIDYEDKEGHIQSYFKDKIKYFYCGEYGDALGRPHYHAMLFNVDFPDKKFWFQKKGFKYYKSEVLHELWPYGNCVITDLNFSTACYVARYAMKKVNGPAKDEHYKGLLPEFAKMSTKTAIGYEWFMKYCLSDVYPSDEVIVKGFKSKPPRYYDKKLEMLYPDLYEQVKSKRLESLKDMVEDNTHARLCAKEKCVSARLGQLSRELVNL